MPPPPGLRLYEEVARDSTQGGQTLVRLGRQGDWKGYRDRGMLTDTENHFDIRYFPPYLFQNDAQLYFDWREYEISLIMCYVIY